MNITLSLMSYPLNAVLTLISGMSPPPPPPVAPLLSSNF